MSTIIMPPLEMHPRDLYQKSKLTHEQLSVHYGVARETVSRWISGKQNPRRSIKIQTVAIARELGIEL
jgi:DNA-binding transcriptional regulator YiaG